MKNSTQAKILLLLLLSLLFVPLTTSAQSVPGNLTILTQGNEETVITPITEQKIMLWVPPYFATSNTTEAGMIISAIIDEFMAENPHVSIETRIKAYSGEASAINTLSAAKNTAPEVIPTLIIFSQKDMESAAHQGLIYPFNTNVFTDSASWYGYAKSAAVLNNQTFGIPIAGDGLVIAHRAAKTVFENPDWSDIMSRGLPIAFLPANQSSLFSTFIYRAMGGKTTNESGQAWLDQTTLTHMLEFFLEGGRSGSFPPAITQTVDQEQNWQLFTEGTYNMLVTQFSTFTRSDNPDIEAIPIPLFAENTDYPLLSTWLITLSESDSDLQSTAFKLAEKFSSLEHNDRFSAATGFLPVRISDHEDFFQKGWLSLITPMIEQGTLAANIPNLARITSVLNESVVKIIRNSATPAVAAQEAIDALR